MGLKRPLGGGSIPTDGPPPPSSRRFRLPLLLLTTSRSASYPRIPKSKLYRILIGILMGVLLFYVCLIVVVVGGAGSSSLLLLEPTSPSTHSLRYDDLPTLASRPQQKTSQHHHQQQHSSVELMTKLHMQTSHQLRHERMQQLERQRESIVHQKTNHKPHRVAVNPQGDSIEKISSASKDMEEVDLDMVHPHAKPQQQESNPNAPKPGTQENTASNTTKVGAAKMYGPKSNATSSVIKTSDRKQAEK